MSYSELRKFVLRVESGTTTVDDVYWFINLLKRLCMDDTAAKLIEEILDGEYSDRETCDS